MYTKYFIILNIFVIFSIRANAENNDTEFRCDSQDHKIRQSQRENTYVSNVCLSSDYQIDKPPSKSKLSEIAMTFAERRILDVDERRKCIIMLINVMVFWEDARIKTKLPLPEEGIALPPFEMTKREIWFPLAYVSITGMKEFRPIFDPIVSKEVRLLSSGSLTTLAGENDFFQSNKSMILGNPIWKVTFACDFDFGMYPFDKHNCSLRMMAENIGVKMFERSKFKLFSEPQHEKHGFNVSQIPITFWTRYNGMITQRGKISPCGIYITRTHTSQFGINIILSRQLSPFVYQYYIPSTAIVMTSFLSFFIPLTSIPGRVAVCVTQFLTLTNIFIHEMVRLVIP